MLFINVLNACTVFPPRISVNVGRVAGAGVVVVVVVVMVVLVVALVVDVVVLEVVLIVEVIFTVVAAVLTAGETVLWPTLA